MSRAADFNIGIHELARMRELRESGQMPVPRDVLSADNSHHSPNYEAPDPFYSGPSANIGGSALHFADIARPDLGEGMAT